MSVINIFDLTPRLVMVPLGRPHPLFDHGCLLDSVQGVGFDLPLDRRGHHATMIPRVSILDQMI